MKKRFKIVLDMDVDIKEMNKEFIIHHLRQYSNFDELNNDEGIANYDNQVRLQHKLLNNEVLLKK